MESRLIPSVWELPDAFSSRLGENAGRQRVMEHEGHLLLILHVLPGPTDSKRQGILFWRDPEGNWKTTGTGNGTQALKDHVETFELSVDNLDQRLDQARTSKVFFEIIHEIVPIQRAAKNLLKALQDTREILEEDKDIITLRDLAYSVERNAEIIREEAANGLNFAIARQSELQSIESERQSNAAHRLNMLAAIFLPLTAVGTMLGMNITGGLGRLDSPGLFWGIIVLSIVLGFATRKLVDPKYRSTQNNPESV